MLASVVALLAASVASSALAQGQGKGKGRIIAQDAYGLAFNLEYDANGNKAPNWGDAITFTVSLTEPWNQVNVTCSQQGVLVYGAVYPLSPVLSLSSANWSSGAADCTAVVMAFDSKKVLASLSFTVAE